MLLVTIRLEEDYTLDQLGNWENLTKKTGGSTTLNQDRTHNAANENANRGRLAEPGFVLSSPS